MPECFVFVRRQAARIVLLSFDYSMYLGWYYGVPKMLKLYTTIQEYTK